MKNMKHILPMVLAAAAMTSLMVTGAQAADYNFTTTAPQDYYNSSSYEDVYGTQYNYGGKNVIDYQAPELEYGVQSTTMTGVMERTILPGLQGAVATNDGISGGYYGVAGSGGPLTVLTEDTDGSGSAVPPNLPTAPTYQQPTYTSVEGMAYKDGGQHEKGPGALQFHLGLGRKCFGVRPQPGQQVCHRLHQESEAGRYHHLYYDLRHPYLSGHYRADHLQYRLELSPVHRRQPHYPHHLPG